MHGTEAQQIKEHGWRQGSVLSPSIIEWLVQQDTIPPHGIDEIFLVISHDCDVGNPSFEREPYVELLKGVVLPLAKREGALAWGKNPRRYQLPCQLHGENRICQFSVHDRIVVDRTCLAIGAPDSAVCFDADSIRELALWIARRYVRTALPDVFVDRTRAATSKLRTKLKKRGKLLAAVYITVEDEELPDGVSYEVLLIGAMRTEDYEIPLCRQEAQALLDDIEAAMGSCDGIEVKESVLKSEAEISLDDRRFLKRWDFDDLTIRGRRASDLPPMD